MKYLLLAALALTGCVHHTWIDSQPQLPEPPSVNQTIIGFNDGNDVSYACKQSEVNPALVWVECKFRNFAAEPKGMCIQVSYELNNVKVATSKTLCSGPLAPGENKENYVAFTSKSGRAQLESCGYNMIQCKMTAQEVTK